MSQSYYDGIGPSIPWAQISSPEDAIIQLVSWAKKTFGEELVERDVWCAPHEFYLNREWDCYEVMTQPQWVWKLDDFIKTYGNAGQGVSHQFLEEELNG